MIPKLYVLSPCFLRNIEDGRGRHNKVLSSFVDNEHWNLAVDKSGKLRSIYKQVVSERESYEIKELLKYISGKKPDIFISIADIRDDITNEEDICLQVCKRIVDNHEQKRPLIVYSRQNFAHRTFTKENEVEYEGCRVWFVNLNDMLELIESQHAQKTIIQQYVGRDNNGQMAGESMANSRNTLKI